jgi:hypothetical protein
MLMISTTACVWFFIQPSLLGRSLVAGWQTFELEFLDYNNMKIKYPLFVVLLLCFVQTQAQSVEMADVFRSNGKIYVVLASITFILAGFFYALWRTDLRVKKLEDSLKK